MYCVKSKEHLFGAWRAIVILEKEAATALRGWRALVKARRIETMSE